jgi:hypothetical protein
VRRAKASERAPLSSSRSRCMAEPRLDPPSLLRGLGDYERAMMINVVQGLSDGAPIEIEFTGSVFDTPLVCMHVCNELRRRLSTSFKDQLPSPRMRNADQEVI